MDSTQFTADEWHKELLTAAQRNAVQPRRWGMRVTVYDDPTPANNGDFVLSPGLSNLNRQDNANWLKVAANGATWGGGGGSSTAAKNQSFNTTGVESTFTVSNGTLDQINFVEVNGEVQRPTVDYTVAGQVINFGSALPASCTVVVYYYEGLSVGSPGGVQSVTGDIVDNSDPVNPIIDPVVDGVTIQGLGTVAQPWTATGLQTAANLADVASLATSRGNLNAAHDRLTIFARAANFSPVIADFASGGIPEYRCTASLTITLPADVTQAIPIGSLFYGQTLSGFITTFAAGSGATVESSTGGFTVTGPAASNFYQWAALKSAANTWSLAIGIPPVTSPFTVTFLAVTSTFTNMPAGIQEIAGGTTFRFRTKVDLTNYQQVRVTAGVGTAGSTNAGFYIQYSTDDTTFVDIGTGSGADIAVIGTTGTKASGWVNLPVGAKADVFLRVVSISGDGAADPVIGLIMGQFR